MSILEQLRRGTSQMWDSLSDGWRRLMARSGRALTRFVRQGHREEPGGDLQPVLEESWGLMAAEVAETPKAVIVRLEAPGLEPTDFDIEVDDGHLLVRGEKKFQREERDARYHLFEAAYGAFERVIPLPADVEVNGAKAKYRRGVLTVELPKTRESRVKRIPVEVR